MASDPVAARRAREITRPTGPRASGSRAAQAARDADFPIALRGYDREAVDRYVAQVNGLIAELEVSSSPASAVQHALEQVTEETRGILQQAHATADEITTRSRVEVADRMLEAERAAKEVRAAAAREADEMRTAAEARVEELRRNRDEIAAERLRLIEEVRATAQRLAELAEAESARFAAADPS